tara:strand:+ start:133 stop:555 length:423 start_codon:yes stop_codon:yes gene_type:complete
MAEYDNTNSGAAFKPFDTQRMILQGKLNIDGNDNKIVLVADQTKAGMKIVEVYKKMGVMFENDKKGNEKAPDYSGPIDNSKFKIAGWKRVKETSSYMSMQVSESQQQHPAGLDNVKVPEINFDSAPSVPPLSLDDEIPPF